MKLSEEASLAMAKLKAIKKETRMDWTIVIRAAEETASGGIVNVLAAITWINIRYRICLN